jgi:hypothetical protein
MAERFIIVLKCIMTQGIITIKILTAAKTTMTFFWKVTPRRLAGRHQRFAEN